MTLGFLPITAKVTRLNTSPAVNERSLFCVAPDPVPTPDPDPVSSPE